MVSPTLKFNTCPSLNYPFNIPLKGYLYCSIQVCHSIFEKAMTSAKLPLDSD